MLIEKNFAWSLIVTGCLMITTWFWGYNCGSNKDAQVITVTNTYIKDSTIVFNYEKETNTKQTNEKINNFYNLDSTHKLSLIVEIARRLVSEFNRDSTYNRGALLQQVNDTTERKQLSTSTER